MTLPDIIVTSVLAVLLGAAILYIYKSKKRGEKCIGCPYARDCSGGCSSHGTTGGKNASNTQENSDLSKTEK